MCKISVDTFPQIMHYTILYFQSQQVNSIVKMLCFPVASPFLVNPWQYYMNSCCL